MLKEWGTTCGKCRPHLVGPKTQFFVSEGLGHKGAPAEGMSLGWLVVIRSLEQARQGNLIDLDRSTVVLSRAGAPPAGADKVESFHDRFMSSYHATVRCPANGDRSGSFTISDRENPSPSINGTFVNSRKLASGQVVRLAEGDIVKVGATELLFKSLWLAPAGR